MREPKRVANRHDPVAHFNGGRITERQRGKVFSLDLHNGEVRHRVGADNLRLKHALVCELHVHRVRALDDVVVRHDEAVRLDDEARSKPLGLATLATEKKPAALALDGGRDGDNRGIRGLHDGRKRRGRMARNEAWCTRRRHV